MGQLGGGGGGGGLAYPPRQFGNLESASMYMHA